MTGSEIREKFINYFRERDHEVIRSSSLIPKDDPTLLFTNAGMVQFKNVFLGTEKLNYTKAVSSQKCVRAGGKHNDLDNVGYTARHHTFFEMLGNFSFGDYFKKEAIEYGWDLMINVFKLPRERLWVTVYNDDQEAFDIWKNDIGLVEERIIRMGEKDNFWSMGDTGPCGPCSEILIDQGEEFSCGKPTCKVGCDCDRYLELWNLVFMQYNRDENGDIHTIPNPSIDTGMGLERIAAVIQGVKSNYETDLLKGIINRISGLVSIKYGKNEQYDTSMRVIADHSRAVAFLITDGVFPSNEGRGYVLRRILRRAVRHAKMLGVNEPFVYRVLPAVNEILGDAYPELHEKAEFVSKVVRNEEERFLETIDRGLELLEQEIQELKSSTGKKTGTPELSGEVVFKLYDTYGFPYDLTEDITRNEGITIDRRGFDAEMKKQKEQSRQSWKGAGDDQLGEVYTELVTGGLQTLFTGYDNLQEQGVVRAIIKNGLLVDSASAGDEIEIITDKTPFYGQSGGQVGDKGTISSGDFIANVYDTKKPFKDLIVQKAKVEKGTVWIGDTLDLEVDRDHRHGARVHHTCTHILHATLKETLGDHISQAGSLVAPDRLRFDFTHFEQIKPEALNRIEEIINERIRRDDPVETKANVPYDEAIKSGATAIFEEKYGDRVRIVSIGDYSMELCGGTHLSSSGEAGILKITSEGASSSGVRRIEAVAGDAGWNYIKKQEQTLDELASILKVPRSDLVSRLKRLRDENEELKRQIESYKSKSLSSAASDLVAKARDMDGIRLLAEEINVSSDELRNIWDNLKQELGSGIAVLGSRDDKKAFILVGVTDDLTSKYNAGRIIKELAGIIGGGGGGKADMAQAGGGKPQNLTNALESSEEVISRIRQ